MNVALGENRSGGFKTLSKKLSKEKVLGCVVLKNDQVLFEHYKNKKVIEKKHKVNSCTKSVLSILIGIAFDKGYLKDLQQPLTDYFTQLIYAQEDKRKRELTLYHLLTMTSGIHFPEWGEWNGFAPMVQGGDVIKFVLDRKLEHSPGEVMNYNSGCSHILASILQKATGVSALDFANQHLFGQLGINQVPWYSDNKGVNRGADGLRLSIQDMIKIGQLYLQNGKYHGKQIISKEWVKLSVFPHHLTYEHIGYYGYHWWTAKINKELDDLSDDNRFYFALGFGGQYIIVVPKFDLIVIFVSSLYDASLKPLRYFREYILKEIKETEVNYES